MARIVIVDDERLVLYGIRSYLLGADIRHVVVGSFTRAEEALTYCKMHPPDIVLTDIRMPGMDGLELIAALKAEQPSPKVVVLSCHDDYPLVRKAFTLGASEYVLKDEVEETNLLAMLDSLCAEAPVPVGRSGALAGDSRSLAHFFAPFPDPLPPSCVAEIQRTLAAAGMRISGASIVPALLAFRDEWTTEPKLIPWSHDTPMLTQIVQCQLDGAGFGEAFTIQSQELACLFELPPEGRPSKHETLRRTLQHVLDVVGRYCNRQAFIGVAERAAAMTSLGEACQEARRALEYRFYEEKGVVLFADVIRAAAVSTESRATQPWCPLRFSPELSAAEMDAALEGFLKTITTLRSIRPRTVCLSVAQAFRDHLTAVMTESVESASESQVEAADLLEIVSHADSLALLRNAAHALVKWIVDDRHALRASQTFSVRARAFLENHYRNDIQLPEAAKHFHMTAGHFCEIFHREMGATFVNYLNEMRITKAKAVLCGTNASLKEIAASVGYHNPNYFSRVFKRYTGSTVSSFRQKCRGGYP
jgi:two-component system, response regulator YesN